MEKEKHKSKRRTIRKGTKKATNKSKAERENTIRADFITNYQTPESIVKIILDKIINLSIRQSRINKINNQIKSYCFEFIQNQIEPLFEEKYINYTKTNNKTDIFFWKNKKPEENQWIELKEPDTPKDDRFEGAFTNLKKINKKKKIKINKIKEGMENALLNIINNEKENSFKDDNEKNQKNKQIKKKVVTENIENKNKDEENNSINKAKPIIQPNTQFSKGNKKIQLVNFPSFAIPGIEKEFNHEEYDPQDINKLRIEREEEIKRKLREAKLREEEKKIIKKKDNSDKLNRKEKQLDSNKFTFDSNGKIISFKQYKLENLSKDFNFIKNTIKESSDSIKATKKRKISIKGQNIKISEEIIKNPIEEEKIEKSEKISEKNKDKVIPSGSNFQIILPNIGVVIKENQKIKEGGREFNKYFKKYSINDYDKILNEYVPMQNKTHLKNKMNKMNLANLSSSNIPAAKKTSESVDNPRSNTINNLQNNINKTFNYNFNYNSNDSLNKNNPLLTTNDNIQININDTDNNNINNTSSSYLKTSVGINSFNKNSNNYNPLMTSFNLRSAFMNINNTARRGISFNDSIMMKKAGASSLKLEIDSMADLRNDKATYHEHENLKQNNIFGRNFMKNYKIGLFKPLSNNSLNALNKNILVDTNWGNKTGGEKSQRQENLVFAKHHTKQQALRELGSNILSGIKVKLPRDRKVEINNK